MRKTRWHSGNGSELWPDDAELQPAVQAAQQGQPGAVDALLGRLQPSLEQFFAHEVDRDTADDLTQDALLRVLGALPRLDPARASRYVTRVAHRRLQSATRLRARDAQRFAPIEAALDIPLSCTADQDAEYEDFVRAAGKLPARIRACVLAALEGLSLAEIADSHGVTRGTVRRQLRVGGVRVRAAVHLAETEPHAPPGPSAGLPRRVRETTRFPYRNARFPELRSRGSRGGDVATRAGPPPPWGRAPRPWERRARAPGA